MATVCNTSGRNMKYLQDATSPSASGSPCFCHYPRHGEDLVIFGRLYAVGQDRPRRLPEARSLLIDLDKQGLLIQPASVGEVDPDALGARRS